MQRQLLPRVSYAPQDVLILSPAGRKEGERREERLAIQEREPIREEELLTELLELLVRHRRLGVKKASSIRL